MCIACHTTGFRARYDAAPTASTRRWTEGNVSCQSCHGPGAAHVAWAAADQGSGAGALRPGGDFKTASAKGEVEVCAACHSRRSELTPTAHAGEPLLDHRAGAHDPACNHADGQQRDEVCLYGSFRPEPDVRGRRALH